MEDYKEILDKIQDILSREKKPLSKSDEVISYLNTTFKFKGSLTEAFYTLYKSKSKKVNEQLNPAEAIGDLE